MCNFNNRCATHWSGTASPILTPAHKSIHTPAHAHAHSTTHPANCCWGERGRKRAKEWGSKGGVEGCDGGRVLNLFRMLNLFRATDLTKSLYLDVGIHKNTWLAEQQNIQVIVWGENHQNNQLYWQVSQRTRKQVCDFIIALLLPIFT